MKFDDLDKKMRVFETAADLCVLPGVFMVARLDGRSFTRLTKETCRFEAPFDVRFRDLMVGVAESLMTCGFRVLYAYTESDEISLLFDPDERLFGRKLRKYNSTLAGEASARLPEKRDRAGLSRRGPGKSIPYQETPASQSGIVAAPKADCQAASGTCPIGRRPKLGGASIWPSDDSLVPWDGEAHRLSLNRTCLASDQPMAAG